MRVLGGWFGLDVVVEGDGSVSFWWYFEIMFKQDFFVYFVINFVLYKQIYSLVKYSSVIFEWWLMDMYCCGIVMVVFQVRKLLLLFGF